MFLDNLGDIVWGYTITTVPLSDELVYNLNPIFGADGYLYSLLYTNNGAYTFFLLK